jgi:hypothetical protein
MRRKLDRCLTASFLVLFIVNANFVRAQNTYFIDSVLGNDSNNGLSADSPWKSHTMVESAPLQPGDTVYFARGSVWTGGIQIDSSGSDGQPIVLTNYGTGELPKFSNPDWSDHTGNAIRFAGDWLIADGLYFHDVPPPPTGGFITVWEAGALRLLLGADHCIIRNCYFDTVPKAIQSHGEYTLITHNTMIGEQVLLGSQYWGPIGIQIGIGNHEICYNTIQEFWVTEGHAWGQDGGAMEMDDGRNHKDNVYIHHNRTINNCGFLEISWDYDIEHREVWNLRVAFNVSSDYQAIGFLEAPLHDSYIDNNTFDRTRQLLYNSTMEVQLGTPTVRNNLFILDGRDPYQADDGQHHVFQQNNWYYRVDNPSLVYFPETAAGNGDPGLVGFFAGGDSDYHLSLNSPLRSVAQNLSEFYSEDFDGNPLPDSGAWDIGALQFRGVGITAPEVGEIFYIPTAVSIQAGTADHDTSITRVEFYHRSLKLGEDYSSPYSYTWNVDTAGTYQLTARAIHSDGTTMYSSRVWFLATDSSADGEIIWHSYDVVTNTGFQPVTVLDQNGANFTVVKLYESSNTGGVARGSLFGVFNSDLHLDSFNHVDNFWCNLSVSDAYPYAGKSSVDRGADSGESGTPTPFGVKDLQLHPPENPHLVVAAFVAPHDGYYAVSDLAARRVHHEGETVTYRLFDSDQTELSRIVATQDQAWVSDESVYVLGALGQGDHIYFGVGRGDAHYFWDATEIVWTVTYSDSQITSTLPDPQGAVPDDYRLYQNHPNPFNPDTVIKFDLPKSTHISLLVYDLLGREVARLVDRHTEQGHYETVWDGRDANGRRVPSSIYTARLMTPDYANSIKMLLLK